MPAPRSKVAHKLLAEPRPRRARRLPGRARSQRPRQPARCLGRGLGRPRARHHRGATGRAGAARRCRAGHVVVRRARTRADARRSISPTSTTCIATPAGSARGGTTTTSSSRRRCPKPRRRSASSRAPTSNASCASCRTPRPTTSRANRASRLPLHWTSDGLPLGIQLISRYGGEDVLDPSRVADRGGRSLDRAPPRRLRVMTAAQ